MSKRSIRCGSSSTAHKWGDSSATLDEGPPLSSATSSSLAKLSSSFIPRIPLDLIADLILPFVADRVTWNSLCCASKDLCLAGKKMTPPWPNKVPVLNTNLGRYGVLCVVFSPSGSHLAFCINTLQPVVHVWDRWGKEITLLAGCTRAIRCLEYSPTGEYLAAGCKEASIRLWHTESLYAASSKISRQTPTRAPKQADIVLIAPRYNFISTLSFSRTNSNLLASGGSRGQIQLWNVKERSCIHSFDPTRYEIKSLYYAGGSDNAFIAVAGAGYIIRFWKAEGSIQTSNVRPLAKKQ